MIKAIIKPAVFILLISLLISCEKNEPVLVEGNCLLKSYASQNKGTGSFEYRESGLVKSYIHDLQGFKTKVELTHNSSGDLISSLWYFDNVLGSKEIYIYQNGLISKVTVVNPMNDADIYGNLNIKHDNKGRIIEIKVEFGDPMIDRTLSYTYNDQGLAIKYVLHDADNKVVFIETVTPKGSPAKSSTTFLTEKGLPYDLVFGEAYVDLEAGQGSITELQIPDLDGKLKVVSTRTITGLNINAKGYCDNITSSDSKNSIKYLFENCN